MRSFKEFYLNEDKNNLKKYVELFYKDIQNKYGTDDDSLKALCYDISVDLKNYLIKNGFNVILVQGTFSIDNPDFDNYDEWDIDDFENEEDMQNAMYNPLHYWIEVDDNIIDLTIKQFQDEVDEQLPNYYFGKYNNRYNIVKKIK